MKIQNKFPFSVSLGTVLLRNSPIASKSLWLFCFWVQTQLHLGLSSALVSCVTTDASTITAQEKQIQFLQK